MPREIKKPASDDTAPKTEDGNGPVSPKPSHRAKFDARDLGIVRHDDLGNAVFNWHTQVPGRREEDPTIDLIECLDVDGMSIEEDEGPGADEEPFEPYARKD